MDKYLLSSKYLLELFPAYRFFWNLSQDKLHRFNVRLALLRQLSELKRSEPKLLINE